MAFPGSEELIAAAEATLGRRLPDAHRTRLIRENGGEVHAARDHWTLYPVWDRTDPNEGSAFARATTQSGDATPSPDDLHLTAEALAAGRLLDIQVLDHIVVASGGYASLRESRRRSTDDR
jgi:hypothetical protein